MRALGLGFVFNFLVLASYYGAADPRRHRLFAFIAVGGTLGGIVGGAATALLVKKIGPLNLLFISAILLELAARCVRFFPARSTRSDATPVPMDGGEEKPLGGNIWAGVTHVVRSPYLLGISAFLLLYGVMSTLACFQQADIAAHQLQDRANRTAFFAQVDLSVNALTIWCRFSSPAGC